MYANENGFIVYDNQQYIGLNGIQYPANYPRAGITELHLVTETAQPSDPTLNVVGFTVDENYVQVWNTVAKTQAELDFDLVEAKTQKIIALYGTYLTLREADIELTTLGAETKEYQTDREQSIYAMQGMIDAYQIETPNGFYWISSDNTKVTPFLRADLLALVSAIGDRANTYFQYLQTRKDAVLVATTLSEVDAITW